jgi:hypothetical protein
VPVAVGATVAEPLADCVLVNVPPMVLDVDAVQEVALVDVHANCTAPPKLILVALAGDVNVTVGIGVGGGVGIDIDIDGAL